MIAIGPGGQAGGPPQGLGFTLVGNAVRGFRVNNDGTFTPIVTMTCISDTYLVQFTFSILASTYDASGGPQAAALRTTWVDQVCSNANVIGFRTETDQGPDQVLYHFAVITVGSPGETQGDEVRQRMDLLNDPSTFAMIDAAWQLQLGVGAS
jgi:hypothetical protein